MTIDTPRRTEYVRLAELKVNPRNPKSHNLEEIDASVKRFGTIDPIVRDDRTGYIISGHGRRETLTLMFQAGEDAPDGVLVNESGEWLVPVGVGWSSRTDAEATAALIALNRTTELGGWVDDSLLDALDSLDDYSGVGFSEDDIDDLRAKLEEMSEEPVTNVSDASPSPLKNTSAESEEAAEDYAAEGRRLVILDYSVAEYPIIQARLKALREAYSQDNNAAALEAFLAEAYPDVVPAKSAPEDIEPIDEVLGVETFDA